MNAPYPPGGRKSKSAGCINALLVGLGLLAAAFLLLVGICSR